MLLKKIDKITEFYFLNLKVALKKELKNIQEEKCNTTKQTEISKILFFFFIALLQSPLLSHNFYYFSNYAIQRSIKNTCLQMVTQALV